MCVNGCEKSFVRHAIRVKKAHTRTDTQKSGNILFMNYSHRIWIFNFRPYRFSEHKTGYKIPPNSGLVLQGRRRRRCQKIMVPESVWKWHQILTSFWNNIDSTLGSEKRCKTASLLFCIECEFGPRWMTNGKLFKLSQAFLLKTGKFSRFVNLILNHFYTFFQRNLAWKFGVQRMFTVYSTDLISSPTPEKFFFLTFFYT